MNGWGGGSKVRGTGASQLAGAGNQRLPGAGNSGLLCGRWLPGAGNDGQWLLGTVDQFPDAGEGGLLRGLRCTGRLEDGSAGERTTTMAGRWVESGGGRAARCGWAGMRRQVVLLCQVRVDRRMWLLDRAPNLRRSKLCHHRLNLIYVGQI
jgi:hypothetical protein